MIFAMSLCIVCFVYGKLGFHLVSGSLNKHTYNYFGRLIYLLFWRKSLTLKIGVKYYKGGILR